jgi:4-hydroxy-tetrahydrodipicolinate synthase
VQLEGSIVPLVTPFKEGTIDEAALEGLVERQIEAGSHGISVGGTTGEPAALSLEEREEVIELALRFAAGRVPVLAGSGTVNLEETLRLTRFAHKAGAAGGLVITPYYVKPNQEGLYSFFARVALEVPDFPLVIYNIPGRAAVGVEVRTLARLAKAFRNIVGVKHSVKDLDVVSWTIRECGRDFKVFCGLESLTVPMLMLGGHGMIAATGNILPKEVARQYDLVKAGRYEEAVALHYHLLEINDSIFWDTNPIPLKTVLSMMGLIEKEWRAPLGPAGPEIEARLKEMAARYGLLEAAVA